MVTFAEWCSGYMAIVSAQQWPQAEETCPSAITSCIQAFASPLWPGSEPPTHFTCPGSGRDTDNDTPVTLRWEGPGVFKVCMPLVAKLIGTGCTFRLYKPGLRNSTAPSRSSTGLA